MTHRIDKPGVYDLPEEVYHADPAPAPSLSKSVAHLLLTGSPRHAWQNHPRLNPAYEPDNDKKYDVGSAAHAVLLEGKDKVVIVDADSFRTKAAKEARDAAYARGKIPLLPEQAKDVTRMVTAATAQLKSHAEAFNAFATGKAEQTLIWQDGGIWCRARPDWLPEPAEIVWDYKTTTDANPDVWQRRLFDLGYDLQAAFYSRGVKALGLCDRPEFRFIVQEASPPYALSVIALSPAALALAEAKAHRAIEIWKWCIAHDCWPGYLNRTCYVEPPPWELGRWEEMKARDEVLRDQDTSLLESLMRWQAPIEKGAAE